MRYNCVMLWGTMRYIHRCDISFIFYHFACSTIYVPFKAHLFSWDGVEGVTGSAGDKNAELSRIGAWDTHTHAHTQPRGRHSSPCASLYACSLQLVTSEWPTTGRQRCLSIRYNCKSPSWQNRVEFGSGMEQVQALDTEPSTKDLEIRFPWRLAQLREDFNRFHWYRQMKSKTNVHFVSAKVLT